MPDVSRPMLLATFKVRLRNALIQQAILFGAKGGSDGAFVAMPTSAVSATDLPRFCCFRCTGPRGLAAAKPITVKRPNSGTHALLRRNGRC